MSKTRTSRFVHELNMYWTKANTYSDDVAYSGVQSATQTPTTPPEAPPEEPATSTTSEAAGLDATRGDLEELKKKLEGYTPRSPVYASFTPHRDEPTLTDEEIASSPIMDSIKTALGAFISEASKMGTYAATKVAEYQDLLSNFVLIATPLYNIIRLIMLDCSWVDIAVNVVAIVAGLHKIYRSVVALATLHNAARFLFWSVHKRLFKQDVAYAGFDSKIVVTRTIAILVALCAFCIKGTSALRDVSMAIGAVTCVSTLSESLWNVVSTAFTTDGPTNLINQEMIHQKITQIDEYIALPTHNWSGAKLTEIRNFSNELTKFVTSKAVAESKLNLSVLNSKFHEFEKIRIDVSKQITNSAPIPVPVAIHLHSQLGGVGKSSFVTYAAKMLSLALDNYNPHVYQYTTGAHFPRYLNQDTAFFDEPKASKSEHNVLNTINAIVSEGCPPCPGAEIDTKSQVLRIKTLFTAANRPLETMGLNSCLGSKEAADAMISRFIQAEVCDPELEKKASGNLLSNRFGHAHRKQDFSHLQFKVRDVGKPNSVVTKTADQLISMIIDRMKLSIADFKNKHHSNIVLPDSIAKKRFDTNVTVPESTPTPVETTTLDATRGNLEDLMSKLDKFDQAYSSGDRVFTVFASGRPGLGKSTSFTDCIKKAAMLLGAPVHTPNNHDEAYAIVSDDDEKTPRCIILDDVYANLSTEEQQGQLQELINRCCSDTFLFIISNYAPATTSWKWWYKYTAPCKIADFKVPGLTRRLNWNLDKDKNDYIFHLDFHKFGVPTLVHDPTTEVNYTFLFKKMYEFKYAAKSPKLIDRVPEVLPFTVSEADLWLDFPHVPTPAEIVRALWSGIKPSRIPMVRQLQREFNFERLDTFGAKLLINRFYAIDPNIKVYVRVAGMEYYLADGFYASSEVVEPLTFNPETKVATLRNCEYAITPQMVVVAMATVPPPGIENLELIAALRNERLRNSTVWRTITANVEVPATSVLQSMKDKLIAGADTIKRITQEHPYLAIGVAMFCIVAGTFYTYFRSRSQSTTDAEREWLHNYYHMIAVPDCLHCNRYEEGGWLDSPFCPYSDKGSEDVALAGFKGGRVGKLKGRPGKHYRGHRSTFTIRGAVMEYDEDDDHGANHLRHEVRRALTEGGEIYENEWSGHKAIKTRAGGSTVMQLRSYYDAYGNHCIDINPVVDDDHAYSPAAIDYQKNVISVTNLSQFDENGESLAVYGLAMTDCVLRVPRHLWTRPSDKVVLTSDRETQLHIVKELPCSDAVFAMPVRQGKAIRLNGIRDITSRLASNMQLPKATRCMLVDPDGIRTANLSYNYYEVLGGAHSVVNTEQTLTHRSAVISYADVGPVEFIKPGKCGSLALVPLAPDEPLKIGGQLSTHRRGRRSYLYSTPTREEWLDFIAEIPAPNDVAYSGAKPEPLDPIPANTLFSPSAGDLGIKPHVPRYFAYKCGNKKEADIQYQDSGITTAASIRNPFPMDPVGRRYPVYDSAFNEEFGMPVMPIASAKDIVSEYPDKIPRDDAGNLHAANVKLNKARTNKYEGHPSHKYRELIEECADNLGKYYRNRLAITKMDPISNEEAMYGCNPPNGGVIEPMDRTTSAGSYRFFQKTANCKGDLIPQRGAEPTPMQAEFVNLCQKQRASWMTDEPMINPFQVQFKDALTGEAKAHKKRLIECGPPSDGVITKSVFAPCQAAFTKLGMNSPLLLSVNPRTDFHAIWSRFKPCTRRYCFDVESFDLSLSSNSFLGFAKFHHIFFNAGPKMKKLINSATFSIYGSPLIVSDTVMRRDASMASGANPTSYTDSIMQMVKIYVACCVIVGYTIPVETFVATIELAICGDDIAVGVHENFENREWAKHISGNSLSKTLYEVFAMKYTNAAKDDSTDFPSLRLEEMEFCSRQCATIPGHPGVYGGKLKLDSIIGELLWSKSNDPAVWRQTVTRAAPVDLAMHSDEVNAQFRKVLIKLKLDGEVESVETIRDTLRYETIQQSAQRNNMLDQPLFISKLQTNTIDTKELQPIPKIDLINKFFPNNTVSQKEPAQTEPPKLEEMGTRELCVFIKDELSGNKPLAAWNDIFSDGNLLDAAVTVVTSRPRPDGAGFVRMNVDAPPEAKTDNSKYHVESRMLPACLSHPYTVMYALKYVRGVALDANDRMFAEFIDEMGDWHIRSTEERLNRTQTKTRRYVAFARGLKHARVHKDAAALAWCLTQGVEANNEDHAYAGEQSAVERHETAAPPDATTESVSGLAMGTAAMPTGVASNDIATVAAQNPVGVGVASGNAIPNVILDGAHGIDMSMTHQTGTTVNVLTLAGTSIFKEIVRLPVGISEGQILYEASVDPWNSAILNPATMLWANMHRRFFGQLAIDIEVVSAATIIGSIKAGIIPACYTRKGAIPSQATLDSFTATQINLAASGKSCIKFTPTTAEHALTGVYVDSDETDYGRLYIIAATDIQNAYDAQATIQLKLSMRMCENSVYDLPTFLGASTNPLAPAHLDIAGPATVLCTDGKFIDGVDYDSVHTDRTLFYGEPENGAFATTIFNDEVAYHNDNRPVDGRVVCGRGILDATEIPGNRSRLSVLAITPKYVAKSGFVLNKGTFVEKPSWYRDDLAEQDDLITWTNAVWKHSYMRENNDPDITIVNCMAESNHYSPHGLHCRQYGSSGSELQGDFKTHIGTKIFDTHEGLRVDHLRDCGTVKIIPSTTNIPAHDASGDVCPAVDHYVGSIYTQDAPICNKAAISTAVCGVSFRPIKIASTDDILPAVVKGLTGQTIPVGMLHATAIHEAVQYAKSQGSVAVVTNLVSEAGQQLCTIVRNSQGAFISSIGSSAYSRSNFVINDSSVRQIHILVNEEFPPLPAVPSASIFQDRTVSSASYQARVGPFTKHAVLTHDQLKDMKPEDDFAYSGPAPSGAAIGGSIFSGLAHDIFGIGTAAMNNANQRAIAKMNNQNSLAIAQLGAETQKQLLAQQMQLKRQFMNQAALSSTWRPGATS